jgi:hypothetical protein
MGLNKLDLQAAVLNSKNEISSRCMRLTNIQMICPRLCSPNQHTLQNAQSTSLLFCGILRRSTIVNLHCTQTTSHVTRKRMGACGSNIYAVCMLCVVDDETVHPGSSKDHPITKLLCQHSTKVACSMHTGHNASVHATSCVHHHHPGLSTVSSAESLCSMFARLHTREQSHVIRCLVDC